MISQVKCINIGVLGALVFVLHISVSHSLTNVTKLEKNEPQINRCKNWQFQCKSGQCIAKPFVCDGLKDCKDDSDETYEQCQKKSTTKCDENFFQCKYGACIEKKYRCDGKKQCVDESDESPEICNPLNNKQNPARNRRDIIDNSCAVPASSADKIVKFDCNETSTSKVCKPSNGHMPQFSVATVTCADGYHSENKETNSIHICYNQLWLPEMANCLKICDKLNAVNVTLQCYRDGVRLGVCDQNSILLAGTKVRPTCESTLYYFEMSCNKDGKWDNNFFPIVPECGKPSTPTKLTIAGENQEKIGESPWHVAIFNKQKVLICGGTLITEYLVLSAALCFSDGSNYEGTDRVDDYEVVIGKYSNNYAVKDNSYQRTMKIKEIRFPEKGYHGSATYHAADLAIIILKEAVPITRNVLPACVNWVDLKNAKHPSEGELGKISGWGRNQNGSLSITLRSIVLPFIGHRRCVDMVHNDFKPYITFDKFCAGTGDREGVSARDGDAGGGILFENNGLFYLRGIASVKPASSDSVTVFTDLTEHIDWIASVRNEVERNSTMLKSSSTASVYRSFINKTNLKL